MKLKLPRKIISNYIMVYAKENLNPVSTTTQSDFFEIEVF